MNRYLDFFLIAFVVFGAAALVYNIHKYGLDPTLAAIKKALGLAETKVVSEAETAYATAKTDLTAVVQRIEALFGRHTAAVQAATATILASVKPIPASGAPVVSQATPAEIASVPPVALDPAAAVSMPQVAMSNLGYVNYLNSLSAAALAAWQSAFVAAAQAATGTDQGALVWSPSANAAVAISGAAQANLVVLRNLGATGLLTGSTPTQ